MIYGSPIWRVGNFEVSFVGEIDKWCPVSPQRFYNLEIDSNRLAIFMKGTPGEIVSVQFAVQGPSSKLNVIEFSCTMPSSGRTMLVVEPETSKTICI